jgi:glyoxylase-like metal-dependent hydrolase (beta-lactamase superfamily II)
MSVAMCLLLWVLARILLRAALCAGTPNLCEYGGGAARLGAQRKEINQMDCCAHEGPAAGDARFDWRKVADGVHVAVAHPAYKVNCNTAVIESDDGVVIVDTHSKPSAARVIVERLREMTSKPVRYVVNTHFHWDHWHGNEVYPASYPDAEIVTNQITREAMRKKGLKRIGDHVRQVPAEIAKLRADLVAAATPEARAQLQANLRLAESYLREVQALRPALPTIAFEQAMKLYRRDREIHLLHLGRAHTEGDVFVYLPKEKVVITGDAVIGWTPYMGDGYPEEWVTTLDRLAELDFTHIIMGHGEPAGRDWLQVFRGYVHDMVEAVREEAAAGRSLDEVKQRVTDTLAPVYEKPFSVYGEYRPWRTGLAANIERTYPMVG